MKREMINASYYDFSSSIPFPNDISTLEASQPIPQSTDIYF